LDKRGDGDSAEYFVKWKVDGSTSWEPLYGLSDCPELVEAYEASIVKRLNEAVDASYSDNDESTHEHSFTVIGKRTNDDGSLWYYIGKDGKAEWFPFSNLGSIALLINQYEESLANTHN